MSKIASHQFPRPGSHDASFTPQVDGFVYQIAVSNTAIYISGSFAHVDEQPRDSLARLNYGGQLNHGFVPQANATNAVGSISLASLDGLFVEDMHYLPSGSKEGLGRVLKIAGSGDVDTGFNPRAFDTSVTATCLLSVSGGKVLVGGQAAIQNNDKTETRIRGVFRLNPNGSLDTGFTPVRIDNEVLALALTTSGTYVIGGNFREVNEQPRKALVMATTNGDINLEFNANSTVSGRHSDTFVRSIQPMDGGNILIGGGFNKVNDQELSHLALLHPNGQLGANWGQGPQRPNGYVQSMARQNNNKVIIGGEFSRIGEAQRERLARFHPDGTLDTTFRTSGNLSHRVYAVAIQRIQNRQYLLAACTFTDAEGNKFKNISRYHADDIRRLEEETAPVHSDEIAEEPRKKASVPNPSKHVEKSFTQK